MDTGELVLHATTTNYVKEKRRNRSLLLRDHTQTENRKKSHTQQQLDKEDKKIR